MMMSLQEIRALVQRGEYARARAILTDLLRCKPSPDALLLAATLCDDVRQAMAYARRALELNPNYDDAITLLRQLRAGV
jgi:tetratricopeptide (TPR) repeat protein